MRAIALGPACNNACIFCAQGDLRESEGASKLEREREVEALLGAIEPGEAIAFQGGEPTLHDELPGWIRLADARGAGRILVQTNGRRLAYEGYVRALRAASTRLCLDVSLHGSNAAMHDYHTGTPGSFEQTVIGLRRARVERIPTALTVVVTRSNFRHLSDLVRIAHVAGAKALHFASAVPVGRADAACHRVVPARDMVASYLTKALAEAQMLKIATLVDDGVAQRANPSDAAQWFAGIGEVAPTATSRPLTSEITSKGTSEGVRRVSLNVIAGGVAEAR